MLTLVSLWVLLLAFRADGQAEFLIRKGDNLQRTADIFLRATDIQGPEEEKFRETIRRKIIFGGHVVQWKVVVCLARGVEELRRQLTSAIVTFPEADSIVLVLTTDRPSLTGPQLEDLRALVPSESVPSVRLKTLRELSSAEQALSAAFELLPEGDSLVAFCIRVCEPTAWPLAASSSSSPQGGGEFFHYTRVMWSYREAFQGPLIAMAWPADDSPCSTERLHALTEHLNLHPSLIMFDTETVRQFPIPNAQDGGIRVWIEAAMRRSMVYMGSQFFRHVTGVRSESSGLNPARVNTHCSAGHCEYFNILVVLEGHSDTSTALVFEDIAITVKDGLDALGCTARIVYCANLATDSCFAEEEQVLVLAAHNLASYFTPQGTLAVLEGNLLPQDAVLYNFEHVPRRLSPRRPRKEHSSGRNRSLISDDTLQIYARYTLWDYSEQNVHTLLAMGIRSELVPLGFSSKLVTKIVEGAQTTEEREHENGLECIDVLFVGTETPRRQATIRRMRDAGITVVYPNAAGLQLFGADLDAVAKKSKIVLSLNAFETTTTDGDHGEWKIARIARLLAGSRFVVAEMSGSASERDALSGGVVFAPSERLAEICAYYLNRPQERAAIAERGRLMYERFSEADILRQPTEKIFLRRRKVSV